MGRGARRGIAALAFATALACQKREPAPKEAPLAVDVSGCAALVREHGHPACVLAPDRKVRVFLEASRGARIDVETGAVAQRDVAGGKLLAIDVPEGATRVRVLRTEATGERSVHTLALATKPRPAWLTHAEEQRQKGELDAAAKSAEAGLASKDDAERAAAEGLLARVALRRGKLEEAERRFRAAIALDRASGRISSRADDAFALAFLLHQRMRRYGDARRVLDEAAGELDASPDGRARLPMYRAQIAWEAGDTRSALRDLARGIEGAERLGAESIARMGRQLRGMVLCNAGSTRSCLATLREEDAALAKADGASACERAEVASALGFAELEAAEAEGAAPAGLGASDARALAAIEAGCPDTYLRLVAVEHLALAAVLAHDAATAKTRLAEAKALSAEPRVSDATFLLDVEAKIAALEGRHDAALAAFDAERALAALSKRDAEVWRALVGRGAVLEATGKHAAAQGAYRAAEDVLDDAALAMPFGEGRGSVTTESAASEKHAVALLLRAGRDAEALDVTRRARTRLARSLARAEHVAALSGEARERWEKAVADYRRAREELDAEASGDWKMARAELEAAVASRKDRHAALRARLDDAMALVGGTSTALPSLSPSEVVLSYADLGAEGIAAFVVEGGRVRSFHVARDATLPSALLTPAAAEIGRASRIRILADDAIAALDLHAAPFAGAPLVAKVPVVYGLDLGGASRDAETGPRRALVVADPTGDLPRSREEGRAALTLLAKRWEAHALVGSEATSTAVRGSLDGIELLHYAGHGVFAGREGAQSVLPLAKGGSLGIGDVLTLGRVPPHVLLSGCEAGRVTGAADEPAAGMARAFLVAGARSVVAPSRVVDDGAASALVRALVDALARAPEGEAPDLPVTLRSAQLAAMRDGLADWQAFRAFER